VQLPLADGGEGTVDALGTQRDGATVVEAAQAVPFDPAHPDVMAASSRPLGELLAALEAERLLIGLGGTANMDAGAGLLEVLDALPAPTTVLCDVQTTLYDAPRLFGPQKGATPEQVVELERRFRSLPALAPFAGLPGSGAAGGLGAALASLGAELIPGAAAILDLLAFDAHGYDLVVTGEGRVDATTAEGKTPVEVVRRSREAGVPCVVFAGLVVEPIGGIETIALSGDPAHAAADLAELGLWLGTRLLDAAR
jgi:glycerate kinase